MKRGLDWYRRDPIAFLGGVQGLSSKEIAVYTITLDLIYQHGGQVHNDPRWLAGWIDDMGASAVRTALKSLIEKGKLSIREDGDITQKRAQTEIDRMENRKKTNAKNGRMGGSSNSKKGPSLNNFNELDEANAFKETHTEKIREDKKEGVSNDTPKNASCDHHVDDAFAAFQSVAADIGLPVPKTLNATRRKKIYSILSDHGVDAWHEALAEIRQSAFLRGDAGDWKASLDFLLQPSSFVKVIEGNYRQSARASPDRPQSPAQFLRQQRLNREAEAHEGDDRSPERDRPAGSVVEFLPPPERGQSGSDDDSIWDRAPTVQRETG